MKEQIKGKIIEEDEERSATLAESKKILDAIDSFSQVNSRQLILNTAMGFKTLAFYQDPESISPRQLENESLDQMILLEFLLAIYELREEDSRYLPDFKIYNHSKAAES